MPSTMVYSGASRTPHGAGEQEHRAVGGGGDTLQLVDEFIECRDSDSPL